MSSPIVQDFLDAYERTSARPRKGSFGAVEVDGHIACEDSCCPLTVLCLGKPILDSKHHVADNVLLHIEEMYPGFDGIQFFLAFDRLPSSLNTPEAKLAYKLREVLENQGWFL